MNIEQLDYLYKKAQKSYKQNAYFRKSVAKCTLMLQCKDPNAIRLWRLIRAISVDAMLENYRKLNVEMPLDAIRGESFYAGVSPVTNNEIKFVKQIQTENGLVDYDRETT